MSVPNRARSSYLVILSFALLLCCGLAVIGLRWQQDRSERWVHHTVEVQKRIDQIHIAVLKAELAKRRFLFTVDPFDLAAASAAREETRRDFTVVAGMTKDNPRQKANLAALRNAVERLFANTERTIELARQGRFDAARGAVDSGERRDASAQVVNLMKRVELEEASLLRER
ncbi:MAG TPA: CHASE3 domain-containing protein, partial [Sphingomicrobium sp.]